MLEASGSYVFSRHEFERDANSIKQKLNEVKMQFASVSGQCNQLLVGLENKFDKRRRLQLEELKKIAPTMLDVALPPGGSFRHAVPTGHAAFVLVLEGAAAIGSDATGARAGEIAVLGDGEAVSAQASGDARLLVLAGAPIGEPVARRGPFVMNTEAELERAWADYRSGRLEDG
jgi:redox-sensitive bicupin YhaK (pirin superfamily)